MAQVARTDESYGLLGNIRAEMGRAQVTSSELSRTYGGAVSYWTRRINGDVAISADDVSMIARVCGVHPATLFGGEAPAGWTPEKLPRMDSNQQPSDYRTDLADVIQLRPRSDFGWNVRESGDYRTLAGAGGVAS